MKQGRKLYKEEIDLIEYLAVKANYQLEKYWYDEYQAFPMDDGGMGSILLVADNLSNQERFFKAQIADCILHDVDDVAIIISLNIDQNDCLFELDVWKVDYSPVKKIMGFQELLKNPIIEGSDSRNQKNHGVGSSDHIWSRSEIDKMITRSDPMILWTKL